MRPLLVPLLTILLLTILFSTRSSSAPLDLGFITQFDDPTDPYLGALETVTDCGTDQDIFQLQALEISPDPPVKGHPISISAKGLLKDTVEPGANVSVLVKIGLVKLVNQDFDLCELIKGNLDEECPLQPGERELKRTFELPEDAPKGHYRVSAVVTAADHREIACFRADWIWMT
ncbi:Phosphatidylglycerol/phosphatidylinositol transfer protein [Gonapodya sp. JEL0774]|nr:Phosphatidylglycerol/phosphatidylinositol transfer protein [Gonapodya sp. JEL0774]